MPKSVVEACNVVISCKKDLPLNCLAKAMVSESENNSSMNFSILAAFEAILKEPSCSQHVAIVNQTLQILQTYNLYTPSELAKRKKFIQQYLAEQQKLQITPQLQNQNSQNSQNSDYVQMGDDFVLNPTPRARGSGLSVDTGNSDHPMPSASQNSATNADGSLRMSTESFDSVQSSKLQRFDSTMSAMSVTSDGKLGGTPMNIDANTPNLINFDLLNEMMGENKKPVEEKSEAEKKREMMKKRQAAMMKKFNKKQKTFLDDNTKKDGKSPKAKKKAKKNDSTTTPALEPTNSASSTAAPASTQLNSTNTLISAVSSTNTEIPGEVSVNENDHSVMMSATEEGMLLDLKKKQEPIVCPEVDDSDDNQESECVICFMRHEGEKTGQNPLGRMAFIQRSFVSNIPRLKKAELLENSPVKKKKKDHKKQKSKDSKKNAKQLTLSNEPVMSPGGTTSFPFSLGGHGNSQTRSTSENAGISSSAASGMNEPVITMGTGSSTTALINTASPPVNSNVDGNDDNSNKSLSSNTGAMDELMKTMDIDESSGTDTAKFFSTREEVTDSGESAMSGVKADRNVRTSPVKKLFPGTAREEANPAIAVSENSNAASSSTGANERSSSPTKANLAKHDENNPKRFPSKFKLPAALQDHFEKRDKNEEFEKDSSTDSSGSSCGMLEDPNLKTKLQASSQNQNSNSLLIEELEFDAPSGGLYLWSCSHKIHWDCWRRVRRC